MRASRRLFSIGAAVALVATSLAHAQLAIASSSQLEISLTSHDFGAQVVSSSTSQHVTITNNGATATTLAQRNTTGIADFSVASAGDTCFTSTPLAAGASCGFDIRFHPSTTGSLTGSVSWDYGAAGTVATTLTGVGVVAPDTSPPTCTITTMTSSSLVFTAQDAGHGLASITALRVANAGVSIPAFGPGTTTPVEITATRTDPNQSMSVMLRVVDVAGNGSACDAVLLGIRDKKSPVSHVFSGVPGAQSQVTILNGNPGVTSIKVEVNGRKYTVKLLPGETRSLDVAAAMRAGDVNTIAVTPSGKPGGTVSVVLSE